MPASAPVTGEIVTARLLALGRQLHAQRKQLGVSATTAAEAAGLSRVTLHRIERGEPSVTMGAYLNVAAALGLDLGLVGAPAAAPTVPQTNPPTNPRASLQTDSPAAGVPKHVRLADYPQLGRLAWQFQGVSDVTPADALSLYERNWRHIEQGALTPHERTLIQQLVAGLGGSRLLV